MCWYNIDSQNEVWTVPETDEFFQYGFYDGNSFHELIKHPHRILFLKLQAYHDAESFADIHTYREFFESDCVLLLLINDCEYVQIYSKSNTIIDSLYVSAAKNGFSEISIITGENDGRVKMDVL